MKLNPRENLVFQTLKGENAVETVYHPVAIKPITGGGPLQF